jgi:D-glycero-D-manno-heptose 1,7-bisphosphate phosphatase
MLRRAAEEFDLNLPECVVIGDRYRDIRTAQAVGARGVLVLTGYGRDELEQAAEPQPQVHIAANLLDAVRWVINES